MPDSPAPIVSDTKIPSRHSTTSQGAPSASYQSETKHQDIQAWMHGILESQAQAPKEPVRRRVREPRLQKTRSDAELRVRSLRRRSSLWDASVAYRMGGTKPNDVVPPVPPVPAIHAKNPKADVDDASSPFLPVPPVSLSTEAPPMDSAFAFLSRPAEPVLSRQDAIVQVVDADPTATLPRGLRRSKSEDLLHKALKSRRAQKPEQPPPCSCGRNTVRYGPVEPRWHMQDCPIRSAWELTATEPVPPPPPQLTVSTPRGISAPMHLELVGREYEPLDVSGHATYLFGLSQPRLGLVKRATLSGLHGWFKSQEKPPVAPPSEPPRRPSTRRLSRCASLPQIHNTETGSAALTSSHEGGRLPSKTTENAWTGSQRIHELRQHVEERMRQDEATSLGRVPYGTSPSKLSESPPHGAADCVWESPTMQRQFRRDTPNAPHDLTDMFSQPPLERSSLDLTQEAPLGPTSADITPARPAPRIAMDPSAVSSISVLQTMASNDVHAPSLSSKVEKTSYPPTPVRRMSSRRKVLRGAHHVLRPSSQEQIPTYRSPQTTRALRAAPSSDTLRNPLHAPL